MTAAWRGVTETRKDRRSLLRCQKCEKTRRFGIMAVAQDRRRKDDRRVGVLWERTRDLHTRYTYSVGGKNQRDRQNQSFPRLQERAHERVRQVWIAQRWMTARRRPILMTASDQCDMRHRFARSDIP